MSLDDIFDKEMRNLDDQLERGEITVKEYNKEVQYLRQDLDEQEHMNNPHWDMY